MYTCVYYRDFDNANMTISLTHSSAQGTTHSLTHKG